MAVKNIRIKKKLKQFFIENIFNFEEGKSYFKDLSDSKKERNILAGLLVKKNKKKKR